MTNQTMKRMGRWALGLAAALQTFAGVASASPSLETRARVEYCEVGANSDVKTTLAAGQNGNEFFRMYNHEGDNLDYTSVAGTYAGVTAFGSAGDKTGLGIEATRTFGNITPTLNAEHAGKDEDKTRVGAGVDYKLGKLTLGAAVDRVEDRNADTDNNQILAKAIYDTGKDQFGVAGVVKTETKDNTVTAFHCHYGKTESFRDRTWAQANWNDRTGTRSYVLDSILAQNPTFGALSSPWIVGRNQGDMYSPTIMEDALSPERVPLNLRSKGGVVAEVKACVNENKDGEYSGFARADAGYTFANVANTGIKAGVLGFASYDIAGNGMTAGASAIASRNLGRANLCLEATTSQNFSDAATTSGDNYISASVTFPLGVGSK